MKTNILIIPIVAGLMLVGPTTRAATFAHRHPSAETRRPAAIAAPATSGVLPRTFRGGDPLQMLNLSAPAKYGRAEENVSLDPDLPGRAEGVKLLSVSF